MQEERERQRRIVARVEAVRAYLLDWDWDPSFESFETLRMALDRELRLVALAVAGVEDV